jgi:mono/diheme cytochrome c family protein
MRTLSYFLGLCVALAVVVAIFIFAAWRPAIAPIEPPAANSFAASQVRQGAELAAIGNCDVCHTAPGGRPFAGGRAVPTPFGTIYSTNITPDRDTGIGRWSEVAFRRAMRQGVSRDGQYLYPAFPYDHFTLVSDDDDRALYAFLMTQPPVRAAAPSNQLPFPLNIRLLLFGWDVLFLHEGPYRADAGKSDALNRGAYLTEGLGHCGACHTPRNVLGAERSGQKLAGGEAEGWTAYALDASSPAPVPWTAEAMQHYLQHGFDAAHGVARGPMAEVAQDLGTANADDVRAIAIYVAAQHGNAGAPSQSTAQQLSVQNERGKATAPNSADSQAEVLSKAQTPSGPNNVEGANLYAAVCAGCHEGPRAMPFGGIDLALSSGITGPSARNLVNVVLYGLPAAEAARSPIMPGFAASLDDRQMTALATYLRSRFSNKPAWNDVEQTVREARRANRAASVRPAPSQEAIPPPTQQTSGNETEDEQQ